MTSININPFRELDEHEIEKIKIGFVQNGYLIIDDFLKPQYADDMYKFLRYDMKKDLWNWAMYPADPRYIQAGKNHRQIGKKNFDKVITEYRKQKFTYNFYRTLYHPPVCQCPLCVFLRIFRSNDTVMRFKNITGRDDLTGNREMFASSYRRGCFLTKHTDKGNGQIAFVYNLTRDWNASFGGNLFLLDKNFDDNGKISQVFTPKFNRLIMFYVGEEGRPHFVSEVSEHIGDLERIAITGWF